MLKMNTTLNSINLGCKVVTCFYFFAQHFFFELDNRIDSENIKYIAEALKVNRTLTSMQLTCTNCLFVLIYCMIVFDAM